MADVPTSSHKLTGVFTEKIGPLPAIAWAGIAVGGYIAYHYISASRTPTVNTAGDTAVSTTDPSSVYTSDYDPTSGYGNATGTFNSGQTSTATDAYVPPAIADNQTWYRRVTSWLIAQGVDPSTAASTIAAYLSGSTDPLNATQTAALNNALTEFGVPPEGVLTPPPTTSTTTTTTPPNYTTQPNVYTPPNTNNSYTMTAAKRALNATANNDPVDPQDAAALSYFHSQGISDANIGMSG